MKKCVLHRTGPSIQASIADSFFLRLRGLIGRDPRTFGPLLITPCSDIHTFFMSDTIDVVYLSKQYEVVKVAAGLSPGQVFLPVKNAYRVLELPEGSVDRLRIKENEKWEVTF